ncbi:MAG: hypothetical protein WCC03_19885 [Candidatus Acidiferrales bacterium]
MGRLSFDAPEFLYDGSFHTWRRHISIRLVRNFGQRKIEGLDFCEQYTAAPTRFCMDQRLFAKLIAFRPWAIELVNDFFEF